MSDQSFLEQVGVNALGGILVALFAAVLALTFATWFTARRERRAALRARDEAAAEDFYRAYGGFFAAWKAWDDYRGRETAQATAREDRASFLNRVADAEGMLESFLVRLTLERSLSDRDLDTLWCFRRGYKLVRYSVRDDRRVPWKRSPGKGNKPSDGYQQYVAFKQLSAAVAAMIVRGPERRAGDARAANGAVIARVNAAWRALVTWLRPVVDDRPVAQQAADNLAYVTGPSEPVRDRHDIPPRAGDVRYEDDPVWYLVAKRIAEANAEDAPSTRESR